MQLKKLFDKLITSSSGVTAAVVIGILGIIIIMASDYLGSGSKESAEIALPSDEEYRHSLELSVEKIVKDISGDERVQVAVTLESGTEYIYATEKSSNTDSKENKEGNNGYNNETSDKTEESYIIINTGSGEQPLLLSTVVPEVRGVAIVCDSGYDAVIRQKITEAVTVLLSLREDKISISGRN